MQIFKIISGSAFSNFLFVRSKILLEINFMFKLCLSWEKVSAISVNRTLIWTLLYIYLKGIKVIKKERTTCEKITRTMQCLASFVSAPRNPMKSKEFCFYIILLLFLLSPKFRVCTTPMFSKMVKFWERSMKHLLF